jgi:hypothetical protein
VSALASSNVSGELRAGIKLLRRGSPA